MNLQGCVGSRMYDGMKLGDRQDPPLSPISETPPPLTIDQEELLQSTSGALSGTPSSSGAFFCILDFFIDLSVYKKKYLCFRYK